MMETSLSAATEDRIATLEKKVREMEALVKGLTQELLDLKSVAMKMNKQSEERSRQELKRGPIVAGAPAPSAALPQSPSRTGSTVIRPKGARQPEAPAAPPEPDMDMIMQPDGTMKLEAPARGQELHCRIRRVREEEGCCRQGRKQSDLIYATEETKSDPAKK